MDNQSLTLTVEEAGEVLGISRAHAYRLAREHRIPNIKLGKRVVVPRYALERFIEAELQAHAS